jgi:hypothetical protein
MLESADLGRHLKWVENNLCKKPDCFSIPECRLTPRTLSHPKDWSKYSYLCSEINSARFDSRILDYLIVYNYFHKIKMKIGDYNTYNKLLNISYLHFSSIKSDFSKIKSNKAGMFEEQDKNPLKTDLYLQTIREKLSPLFFLKVLKNVNVPEIYKTNKMRKYLNFSEYFITKHIILDESDKFLF